MISPFFARLPGMSSTFSPRNPLYQELSGVAPSSRRIILSSKSEMRRVIGWTVVDLIEQHLEALLGHPRILLEELMFLVVQVCEAADVLFKGAHALDRSIKREVFEWIGEN
jgi:hypothetical protein